MTAIFSGGSMSITDYQTIMLPLLKYSSDDKEHSFQDEIMHISDYFKLTDNERNALLSSATQEIINNRVGWAKTYLKKAGLFEDPKRGKELLQSKPGDLMIEYNVGVNTVNVYFSRHRTRGCNPLFYRMVDPAEKIKS
jgi:hypothetical protein